MENSVNVAAMAITTSTIETWVGGEVKMLEGCHGRKHHVIPAGEAVGGGYVGGTGGTELLGVLCFTYREDTQATTCEFHSWCKD